MGVVSRYCPQACHGCLADRGLLPPPPCLSPFAFGGLRYRYFARFLLEGKVVASLGKWTPLLKNKPDIMNKPWVKERVVSLLQRLVDSEVDTRCKLVAQWKHNSKFLMQEYVPKPTRACVPSTRACIVMAVAVAVMVVGGR